VENDLVLALGFEQFELIKELLRNRLRIVWCTRLSRTQVGGRIRGGPPQTGAHALASCLAAAWPTWLTEGAGVAGARAHPFLPRPSCPARALAPTQPHLPAPLPPGRL